MSLMQDLKTRQAAALNARPAPAREARCDTATTSRKARLRQQFSSVNSYDDVRATILNRDLGKVLRLVLGTKRLRGKDLALAALGMGASTHADTIGFDAFCAWHEREVVPARNEGRNRLLVKDLVGTSRASCRALPAGRKTYGRVNLASKESAGQVLQKWETGTRSTRQAGARNVIAENRAAMNAGLCTAKDVTAFRKNNVIHFDAERNRAQSKKDRAGSELRNRVFGAVAKPSANERPVAELIQGGLGGNAPDLAYPPITGADQRRLRKPRSTRTAECRKQYTRDHYLDPAVKPKWTMSKFAGVKSHFEQARRGADLMDDELAAALAEDEAPEMDEEKN